MSLKKNEAVQISTFDSFLNMSEKRQKRLERSWAGSFFKLIVCNVEEEDFFPLYADTNNGRPNVPINVLVSAFIMKELADLTDEELVDRCYFDEMVRVAFGITGYDEPPVSERTISRFRWRLAEYSATHNGRDLFEEEIRKLAGKQAEFMKLNPSMKRMDSLMIASHAKSMTRLQILYVTAANAVKLLHKHDQDALIPESMMHYLEKDDENRVIYHAKNEDISTRIQTALNDIEALIGIMSADEYLPSAEHQALVRVFSEQTKKDINGKTVPKDKSEISPDSMQNPNDPDTTYRFKAGNHHKGYVENLIETYDGNGHSLVTDFDVKANTYADDQFGKDYIDSQPEDGEPQTMITDGAYGSVGNIEAAEKKNITLVSTTLTGKETDDVFADFELNEEGTEILHCAEGNEPIAQSYNKSNGAIRALFRLRHCRNCPMKEHCKAKFQKTAAVVIVTKTMVMRARYVRQLSTEEYQEYAKQRNGVESLPSILRRRYHIDEIPVFTLRRSRVFYAAKIGALNFVKTLKYVKDNPAAPLNSEFCG